MNYKIAQFILTPPQNSQSTLEIYLAQPEADKEALAGKLFALIEIESTKAAGQKITNFLINTLNHSYYQNEKMILRERVDSIKIEHIFESALAKTNKRLAEFIRSEKIKLNSNILNLTIGVVYNDCLHFANLGKNKALLIYKGRAEDTAKYKLTDITEQTGAAPNKSQTSAMKLFSNVISGAIPRNGYFIFANETFGEYLSAKQIISIVTTLPPAGAAEQIKNTLNKINDYVPFLGIIIKNTSGQEVSEAKIKEPITSTKASIDSLVVTEEKTEKLLTPSGLINANKWSPLLSGLAGRFGLNRTGKAGGSGFFLKDKIFTKKKASWLTVKKTFEIIKNLFIYLIGWLIYIFKIITDKKALADSLNNSSLKIKGFWLRLKAAAQKLFFWYQGLAKTNKILFSLFLACLLILTLNLGWQNLRNKTTEKQAAISNLTILIEQKQNQIDASLLYGNEAGAAKLISEVKDLLTQLPENSQSQKDRRQELSAKYRVQVEKISRVIRVNPAELGNFANLNAGAKPNNIILTQGKIFAADAAQSAIYSIDISNKLITSTGFNGQELSRLDFPSLDSANNIYYLSSNSVSAFDVKSAKLSGLDISYSGSLDKAIDLKQYNNRFYLADSSTSQIYRFTKSANRLTGPTPWFAGKEDLAGVVSLDIDGNIYLLKNNGEVLKYAKGKREDLALAAVEPALSQATKLIVSPEEKYLYVFEPINKRLVVFDKDGKFNCQYLSDKFDGLKDFQIDEKNKKAYFLNNTTVYSIDFSHLK